MPVCNTISILAAEIEPQLKGLTPSQIEMLKTLKNMPLYLEQRRLDMWDKAYHNAINNDEENLFNFKVIEMLYDFGCVNLYGMFQPELTFSQYEKLTRSLIGLNFKISHSLDVSAW